MTFNRAAREVLRRYGEDLTIASHDWWTYITVTGVGGCVHYDSDAQIDYRQHSYNQVGANMGLAAFLRRVSLLKNGRFRLWSEQNLSALEPNENWLTQENRQLLRAFRVMHSGKLRCRIVAAWHAGFYRQTKLGNLALVIALIFRKV